jgi:hypothetical protein
MRCGWPRQADDRTGVPLEWAAASGMVLPSSGAEDFRVSLRRSADGVELRVNGVFVMNDRQSKSVQLPSQAVIGALSAPIEVLVGGLGLGYTLRDVLAADQVTRVVVVEIERSCHAGCTWTRCSPLHRCRPGASDRQSD